jgi:hypothetical protein
MVTMHKGSGAGGTGRHKRAYQSLTADQWDAAHGNFDRLADALALGGDEAFDRVWEEIFGMQSTGVRPMADYWPGGEPDTMAR